jgi:23S rRNA pseudouridine1911/1915/1917 synthase
VPFKKATLITTAAHDNKRLDRVLAEWLPQAIGRPVSKSKIRKLIMAGAVYLNGRPLRLASKMLSADSKIEARIDLDKLLDDSPARDKEFELTADRILFEDEDLIVVDKPSGLPTHPTADQARDNLVAAIRRFLSKRDNGAAPYLGVHQRLDRDTSGLLLFTKSQRVNATVAELFARHRIIKIYQALTTRSSRRLPERWTIENYLGKISAKSKRARYGAVKADGELAQTSFRVIAEHKRGTLIEAIPRTGRTHQIRVHLSEYGLPILGDDLYGIPNDESAPRLMLHASQLQFPHPIGGDEISIVSYPPSDFNECLHRLEL